MKHLKHLKLRQIIREEIQKLNEQLLIENWFTTILKLPFKLLGFVLLPIAKLVGYIISKNLSVEKKFQLFKVIVDLSTTSMYEYEDAVEALKGNSLSPAEKKQTQELVKQYEKKYPNGKFDIKKHKQELIDKLSERKKETGKAEEIQWLIDQINSYTPQTRKDYDVQRLMKALNL